MSRAAVWTPRGTNQIFSTKRGPGLSLPQASQRSGSAPTSRSGASSRADTATTYRSSGSRDEPFKLKKLGKKGRPSTARPPKSSEKAEKKEKAVEEEEPPPPPPPPPPAIGLRWQKLAPSKPTTGRELSSESLVEALLQKQYLKEPLQFTAEQYHSFELGAEPLTASDFIKAGSCYFGPERVFTSVQSKIGAVVNAAGITAKIAREARRKKKAEEAAAEASAWLGEWSKWLTGIDGLSTLILDALQMPRDAGEEAAFEYMRSLTRDKASMLLEGAGLGGLLDVLMKGIDKLEQQCASSGPALNEKFQQTGKFTMGYGTLDVFFNGLEQLLGPPSMVKDPDLDGLATICMGMKTEHLYQKDSYEEFTSSNHVTTTSAIEWEFAHCPDYEKDYPERGEGFEAEHPEWCRKAKTMEELMELNERIANSRLRKEGHNELIEEEVLAGRLYTGPMYQKYNAVLRACTGDAYLVDCAKKICRGNSYQTTIHAINSAVIKLSKLTQAGKVYRGVCFGKLPEQFWKASSDGVKGGIEFGFQSTTRERRQAVHYARAGGTASEGDAMTVMEFQMGKRAQPSNKAQQASAQQRLTR